MGVKKYFQDKWAAVANRNSKMQEIERIAAEEALKIAASEKPAISPEVIRKLMSQEEAMDLVKQLQFAQEQPSPVSYAGQEFSFTPSTAPFSAGDAELEKIFQAVMARGAKPKYVPVRRK